MIEQTNFAAIATIVRNARDKHGWSFTMKDSSGGSSPTYELRRDTAGGDVEEVCIVINNRARKITSEVEIAGEHRQRERWIVNPNDEDQRQRIGARLSRRR